MSKQLLKVLIIENSPGDRDSLRHYLQKSDDAEFTILEAETGKAGIEICLAEKPHCVLLNLNLAETDGLSVIKKLNPEPRNPAFAIVLMIGAGNEKSAVEALKSGAQDFIMKGKIIDDELAFTIRNAIETVKLRGNHQYAEADLRESEERFRRASDAAAALVYDVDLTGRRKVIAHGLQHVTGYTNEESNLSTDWWHSLIHREDLPAHLENYEKQLNDGEKYVAVYRIRRKDGALIWVEDTAQVVKDETGANIQLVGTIVDINERKLAEKALRHSEENAHIRTAELEALLIAAPLGTAYFDRQHRYLRINEELAEINGIPAADHIGKTIEELLPINAVTVAPVLDRIFETGEVFSNLEITGETPREPGVVRHWLTGFFPVRDKRGEVILVGAWVTEITERKRAERQLRLYEKVILNTRDAVLITEAEPIDSPGPRILAVNQAFCEMTGYTEEEVIGQTPRILQGAKTDRKQLDKIRHALKNWEPLRVELTNYRKDGSEFEVEFEITPVADERGWFTHWVSVQRDITERKHTQEALRISEERLNLAMTGANIGAFDWNIKTGEIQWTKEIEESAAMPAEAFENDFEGFINLVHPLDRELMEKCIAAAMKDGDYECEFRMLKGDGTIRWVIGKGRVFFDEAGDPARLVGVDIDITKRKQAEEKLLENQQFTKSIIETAPTILYTFDLKTKTNNFLTGQAAQILGYSFEELKDRNSNFLAGFMHPDDLKRAKKHFKNIAKTDNGKVFEFEYRMRHKSGEWRWFISHDKVFKRDAQGKAAEILGIAADITERKRAEDQLRDSDERMRLATEATEVGVWEWNVITDQIRWDTQMFRLYGVEPTKNGFVPYTAWSKSVLPEELAEQEELLQKRLHEGGHGSREFRVKRNDDGAIRYIQAVETVRLNEEGQAEWILGTNLDVTERKLAEAELRRSEEFNRSVLENSPDCVKILDDEGRLEFMNFNGLCLLEIDDFEPFKHQFWWKLWQDDTQPLVKEAVEKALNGETAHFQAFCPTAKGTPKWWDVIVSPIPGANGKTQRIISVSRDLTERKRIELALAESERQSREILESISDGFFALDEDFRFYYMNGEAENILDRKQNKLLGKTIWEEYPETVGTIFEEVYRRVMTVGKAENFTTYYPDQDRWYEVRTYPAAKGISVYFDNATERKQAEAEIKRLSDYNRNVLESITDPFFTLDRDYCFTYISSQGENLVWRERGELIGKSIWEEFPGLFGTPFEKMYRVAMEEKIFTTVTDYFPDHERWYEVLAYPSPNGVTVYFRNISERKHAELNLAFLADLQKDFAPLATESEIIKLASRRISEYLKLTHCLFVEIDDAHQTATVIHDESAVNAQNPVGVYRFEHFHSAEERETLIAGKAIVINDVNDETYSPEAAAQFETLGINSLITAPYVSEGKWKFALCAQSDKPRKWNAVEIEFLNDLSSRIYLRLERARAEENLRQRNLQLDLLSQVSQDLIVGEKSEIKILQTVFDRLAKTLNTELYFNYMVGDEPEILYLTTSRGLSEEMKKSFAAISFGQYLCGKVALNCTLLAVENLQSCEFEEAFAMRDIGVQCYAGFPLIAHGQLIGTVAFATRNRETFRPGELQLIQAVCDQAAITVERARAEEALRESEERFRALFDSIDEGFSIIKMIYDDNNKPIDYRFEQANPAFEKLTGLTDALGKTARELIPDLEKSWFETYGKVALTGEAARFENEAAAMNRWFEVYASRVGDSTSRVAIVFNDITERKLAEREREESLSREQLLRHEAENANHAKDEFLATVSHELRTPLNAILGWATIAQKNGSETETVRRALEVIERSAHNQNQLISDILDVSRIITGKLHLNLFAVRLSDIVRAAIDTISISLNAKNLQLETFIEPDENFRVEGDVERLQQIVGNLLGNAVKFTPEGGRIKVALKKRDGIAEIVISDTGEGIEPDFLPFVFDRFRQADGKKNRKHGGLGLGLAVVRHLTEMHGGSASVASEGLGRGATFTIRLPLNVKTKQLNGDNQLKSQKMPETVSEQQKQNPGVLKNQKILVVDDQPDALELVRFVLSMEGAEVLTAQSADEALKIFDREEKLDAIITDIGMPEKDGFTLLRELRIRFSRENISIPTVALTAYAGEADKNQILKAGFSNHFPKPFESEKLIEAIVILTTRKK